MITEPETVDYDFGYDPTVDEPIEVSLPSLITALPPSASVNTKYLPPVRKQSTPNCAAWASTYGLATFTAAVQGDYSPSEPALQASSAYIYIQVLEQNGVAQQTCRGSQLQSYFSILAKGGTPTFNQAPYDPPCATLWKDYGGQSLQPDPAFTISKVTAVNAKVSDNIKQIIAAGKVLAYGTSLYTDFPTYNGTPKPYVGSRIILKDKKTGKPIGHCMLIIGYNDAVGTGAFYIQNSFGTEWGNDGFIWMAYDTFTTLAQGKAFYAG